MYILLILLVGGYVFYLGSKVTRMEKEIMHLQQQGKQYHEAQSTATVQMSATDEFAPAPVPPAFSPQSVSTEYVQEQKKSSFVSWVKEDFLVKLGALLLLIAFGWFVNFAFANNWIGPMGRIALGLFAGAGIMALGVWRIPSYRQQGGIFVVLGSAVIMFTMFAAREVYDFFTPTSALLIMFLSVVFVAFMSIRYHSEKIAIAGLLLAGVAPYFTNSPDPSSVTLFSYWLVVVLGTLWVVKITGSEKLTAIALLITVWYSIPFIYGYNVVEEETLIGLFFIFIFTALFFMSNIASIIHLKSKTAAQSHTAVALFTGLLLVSWVGFAAPEQWQSMLFIAWMLVFSVGAFIVYLQTDQRAPFYIYSAIGVGLLAAATASELDGAALAIAYSVELLALMGVLATRLRDQMVIRNTALLFIGLGWVSLPFFNPWAWTDGFIHSYFLALLVVTLTFLGTSLLLYKTKKPEETVSRTTITLGVVGFVYALMLFWLVTHSVFTDDVATMLSLVVYTIVGIVLMVRGKIASHKVYTVVGACVLALVTARLLFIDVWQMALVGRVITFAAIGILLISTAFIGKTKNKQTDLV